MIFSKIHALIIQQFTRNHNFYSDIINHPIKINEENPSSSVFVLLCTRAANNNYDYLFFFKSVNCCVCKQESKIKKYLINSERQKQEILIFEPQKNYFYI